jgi:hypothetical protein
MLLIVVLALLMAPGSVAAKATRIECTGAETLIQYLDPGVWTFSDGNIHVRGMVELYEEASTCPQLAGLNTVTMNANWDANYAGPIWGTTVAVTNDGGVWETTWQGKTFADGSYAYEVVGHGVAGPVEGLHMKLSATNLGWTATILDPHGG